MTIAKQINTLYVIVKTLLEKDNRLRDDDKKLSCRIWSEQLGGIDYVKEITAYDFMVMYSNGELFSQESIGRQRRAIQEDIPELRGSNYKEKLGQMEQVQKELGYFSVIST